MTLYKALPRNTTDGGKNLGPKKQHIMRANKTLPLQLQFNTNRSVVYAFSSVNCSPMLLLNNSMLKYF